MKQLRWGVAFVFVVALTVIWKILPATELEASAGLLLGLYVVSFCMLLPRRLALMMLVGIAIVVGALEWINGAKIAFTQAPLTALDFRIALASPRGLWIALKWPPWTMWPLALSMVGLLASLAAAAVRLMPSPATWGNARNGTRLACIALALGNFMYLTDSLGRSLADRAVYSDDLWQATSLADYSHSIGIVPFLFFWYYVDQTTPGHTSTRVFARFLHRPLNWQTSVGSM